MSQRRRIEHHRRNLAEIRAIMASMKSLAYVEVHKLAQRLDAQRAVVASMDAVARDFLSFYPDAIRVPGTGARVCVAIGTERGFCGGANHAIKRRLIPARADAEPEPRLVLVGRKLHTLLESDPRVVARLEGAGAAEEIEAVLRAIVAELDVLQYGNDVVSVSVVHLSGTGRATLREVLPPFAEHQRAAPAFAAAPILNVAPSRFLLALTEQYVLAQLHEILYESLMAESHQRMTHLDGAIRHLDGQTEQLARRANALRQEEIIEEIEVILLNTIEDSPRSRRSTMRPSDP